jgi:hypothetical protein
MSQQLIDRIIPTINTAKVKQFFWNVRDARNFERGIGGFYRVDTTAISTTSTTRVTLKTYTFTSSARTNKIRVRVYARVSNYVSGSTIYLNINGTDVIPAVTVTNTTSQLRIDYIDDIPSNASITVKVDGVAESGFTLFVDRVVIIAGFGLTSTTPVNILTITAGYLDAYVLRVNGNFQYQLVFKWVVIGNKKTTTGVSITSDLAGKVEFNWSVSGDDGDSKVPIRLGYGNYTSSFTISGNVGASGDILIITEIYAQLDISSTGLVGVFIAEKGIAYIVVRFKVMVSGYRARVGIGISPYFAGVFSIYSSDISSDTVVNTFIPSIVGTPVTGIQNNQAFVTDSTDIIPSANLLFGIIDFLNIVVIGV